MGELRGGASTTSEGLVDHAGPAARRASSPTVVQNPPADTVRHKLATTTLVSIPVCSGPRRKRRLRLGAAPHRSPRRLVRFVRPVEARQQERDHRAVGTWHGRHDARLRHARSAVCRSPRTRRRPRRASTGRARSIDRCRSRPPPVAPLVYEIGCGGSCPNRLDEIRSGQGCARWGGTSKAPRSRRAGSVSGLVRPATRSRPRWSGRPSRSTPGRVHRAEHATHDRFCSVRVRTFRHDRRRGR